jgi:hypothetical protein
MSDKISPNEAVLQGSIRNLALVEIVRDSIEIPGIHLVGIPIALGRSWLVLCPVNDLMSFDGFTALRLSDITAVKRKFPKRSFYVNALQSQRATLPHLRRLDLDTESSVLISAQRWFSLLVVDREIANAGAAEVGGVLRASRNKITMRLMDLDATWIEQSETFFTREITRVTFGSRYEEVLAAMAGLKDPKWR